VGWTDLAQTAVLVDGDGWIRRGGDLYCANDRISPVILIDLARGVRDVACPHGLPGWTLQSRAVLPIRHIQRCAHRNAEGCPCIFALVETVDRPFPERSLFACQAQAPAPQALAWVRGV
jgi:hypothetical protein